MPAFSAISRSRLEFELLREPQRAAGDHELAAAHMGDPAADEREAAGGHAQALQHDQPQIQHCRRADADESDGDPLRSGDHGGSLVACSGEWTEL